jgi:hypothetical protein
MVFDTATSPDHLTVSIDFQAQVLSPIKRGTSL